MIIVIIFEHCHYYTSLQKSMLLC